MPRYVAFLRGVSPSNARMPELARCFEDAGFTAVRTLLSSGNVVFDARRAAEQQLIRRAAEAMAARLGRTFETVLRAQAELQALLEADPFARFTLPPAAKRVITFLPAAPASLPALPIEQDGARLLAVVGREAFAAYVPGPKGPVFMTLLERTLGKHITTRTVETVRKCAVG